MPKQVAGPHFDAEAILAAVQQQDLGLIISTNNPKRWREIMYAEMRAKPALRCHIYAMPRSDRSFMLLKSPAPGADQIKELPDVEAAE